MSSQFAHTGSMSANTIRLGTNLKILMSARRLSLKRVSTEARIPYSTLHTWLENRQPKDIVKVKQLCDYLKVGLHELLFEEVSAAVRASSETLPEPDLFFEGVYEVIVRRRGGR